MKKVLYSFIIIFIIGLSMPSCSTTKPLKRSKNNPTVYQTYQNPKYDYIYAGYGSKIRIKKKNN